MLLLLLAAVVVGAGTLGTLMGWVPRGEIFFILVLLVVAGLPLESGTFLPAVAVGAGAASFAVLLTVLEGKVGLAHDPWSEPCGRGRGRV